MLVFINKSEYQSFRGNMKRYKYDPTLTGLLVGLGLIGIWYFSSLAIEKRILPYQFDYILSIFLMFCGAFLAFMFNSFLEDKKHAREKDKNRNAILLTKMEAVIFKLHDFSRASKKYLWSYQWQGNDRIFDPQAQSESRELIYEIEVYKKLYFPNMPVEASTLHSEIERLAGECDKHWGKIQNSKPDTVCDDKLNACKSVASEIENLDQKLKPIFNWCIEEAETYKK